MRTIILLTATSLCLSACGVVQQAQLNTGMQKAQEVGNSCRGMPLEISQAWDVATQEMRSACPSGSDANPLPPSRSIEADECWASSIKKHIAPVESNAGALNELLGQSRQNAEKYKNGELDWFAFNRQGGAIYNKYMRTHTSFYKLTQCKNAALQQYVMPSYPHKGLLMSVMTRQSEVGLAIDNGQMTPEQGDIEIQKAWASLANNEQQANFSMQAQNAQRSRAMMAVGADLLKGPPANPIQHTNCRVGLDGRSMDCTTH